MQSVYRYDSYAAQRVASIQQLEEPVRRRYSEKITEHIGYDTYKLKMVRNIAYRIYLLSRPGE